MGLLLHVAANIPEFRDAVAPSDPSFRLVGFLFAGWVLLIWMGLLLHKVAALMRAFFRGEEEPLIPTPRGHKDPVGDSAEGELVSILSNSRDEFHSPVIDRCGELISMAGSFHFSQQEFLACCGSSKFAAEMAKAGPFLSLAQAIQASRSIWWNQVDIPGWLEAFAAHPRIGDVAALKRDAPTTEWSRGEQSRALESANNSLLQDLAEWNQKYKAKFGFTFLICASGKTSDEILTTLQKRLNNTPIDEIQVAAEEQQRITEIRLGKLCAQHKSGSDFTTSDDRRVGQIGAHLRLEGGKVPHQLSSVRPPITTHVLDVSRGRPAAGVEVILQVSKGFSAGHGSENWDEIGLSITDSDGRSGPLMPPSNNVKEGRYKLTFNTGKYFSMLRGTDDKSEASMGFYPYISVIFEIKPSQVSEHFHVPVLLSPFSYTTYRGS